MNKKYGFVVLHYLAYDMTCRCVDTILEKFGNHEISIVVVDNASANGSGAQLKERYKNQTQVSILLNNINFGFARGNDIGFQYLTENFKPDYIIVMNNDVLIEQDDFLHKIDEIYAEKAFDILGPDIYCTASAIHQNPISLSSEYDFYSLKKRIKYLQRLHKNFDFFYFFDRLRGTIIYHYRKHFEHKTKMALYKEPHDRALLHGACYIFSSSFIKKKNVPFNPATFLYVEEEILYFESIRDGITMVYSPQIVVQHLEDVASNLAYKTEKNKTKMKTDSQLKSSKVLLDLYKEYAKEHRIIGNYMIGGANSESKR